MAHRLGVQSPLEGFVAIGLGVEAVNPLEMARAFSTFANDGARVDGSLLGNRPRAVLAVRDGKRLDVTAPLPPHMQQSFDVLGFDASRFDVAESDPEDG
jgi:hypothetical protein